MFFYENSTAFLILVNPKLPFLINQNRKNPTIIRILGFIIWFN